MKGEVKEGEGKDEWMIVRRKRWSEKKKEEDVEGQEDDGKRKEKQQLRELRPWENAPVSDEVNSAAVMLVPLSRPWWIHLRTQPPQY